MWSFFQKSIIQQSVRLKFYWLLTMQQQLCRFHLPLLPRLISTGKEWRNVQRTQFVLMLALQGAVALLQMEQAENAAPESLNYVGSF